MENSRRPQLQSSTKTAAPGCFPALPFLYFPHRLPFTLSPAFPWACRYGSRPVSDASPAHVSPCTLQGTGEPNWPADLFPHRLVHKTQVCGRMDKPESRPQAYRTADCRVAREAIRNARVEWIPAPLSASLCRSANISARVSLFLHLIARTVLILWCILRRFVLANLQRIMIKLHCKAPLSSSFCFHHTCFRAELQLLYTGIVRYCPGSGGNPQAGRAAPSCSPIRLYFTLFHCLSSTNANANSQMKTRIAFMRKTSRAFPFILPQHLKESCPNGAKEPKLFCKRFFPFSTHNIRPVPCPVCKQPSKCLSDTVRLHSLRLDRIDCKYNQLFLKEAV